MSCSTVFYRKLDPQPTKEEVLKYLVDYCDIEIEFWQKFLTKPLSFHKLVSCGYNYELAHESIKLWTEIKSIFISGELTEETELTQDDPIYCLGPSYDVVKVKVKTRTYDEIVNYVLGKLLDEMNSCINIVEYNLFKQYNIDVSDVVIRYAESFVEYHRILNGGKLSDEQIAENTEHKDTDVTITKKHNGCYYIEESDGKYWNAFRVHDYPDDILASYDDAVKFIEGRNGKVWTDEMTNEKLKQFFDENKDGIIAFC